LNKEKEVEATSRKTAGMKGREGKRTIRWPNTTTRFIKLELPKGLK